MIKQHNPINTYRGRIIVLDNTTEAPLSSIVRAIVAWAVAGWGLAFAGFEAARWASDYLINHGIIGL